MYHLAKKATSAILYAKQLAFCMNKERLKALNETVRWSSNKSVVKSPPKHFPPPFEDGKNIQQETFPKKEGPVYLLGVISRALSDELIGVETDKRAQDTQKFLNWFEEKLSRHEEYTNQDLKDWIDDWLTEGPDLLND